MRIRHFVSSFSGFFLFSLFFFGDNKRTWDNATFSFWQKKNKSYEREWKLEKPLNGCTTFLFRRKQQIFRVKTFWGRIFTKWEHGRWKFKSLCRCFIVDCCLDLKTNSFACENLMTLSNHLDTESWFCMQKI